MADVELLDLRNPGHESYVLYGKAVAGVNGDAQIRGAARRVAKSRDRFGRLWVVRIRPGVQLDRRYSELSGLFDRGTRRIYEEADPDARVGQSIDCILDSLRVGHDVQPAFRRDFLTALRHKSHLLGFDATGDLQHLRDASHLEIEVRADGLLQTLDVVVLDVAAVFPQVRRDSIGTGCFAGERGFDRIRLAAAPCLPER